MKIKFPCYQPILIFAEDWSLYPKENSVDHNFEVTPCWIVGWLISESDSQIVISPEYHDDDEEVRGTIVIPKSCIKYRRFLSMPKLNKKQRLGRK